MSDKLNPTSTDNTTTDTIDNPTSQERDSTYLSTKFTVRTDATSPNDAAPPGSSHSFSNGSFQVRGTSRDKESNLATNLSGDGSASPEDTAPVEQPKDTGPPLDDGYFIWKLLKRHLNAHLGALVPDREERVAQALRYAKDLGNGEWWSAAYLKGDGGWLYRMAEMLLGEVLEGEEGVGRLGEGNSVRSKM